MLKYLQFLDYLERQIIAGRQLVDAARCLPGVTDDTLLSIEEELDSLDDRLADIVDEDVSMDEIDELERRSGDIYRRLMEVGKAISA